MKLIAQTLFAFLLPLSGSAEQVDYLRDIKPLLTAKCSTCHGALRQEAGLRLDAGQLIRTGSESGAVIDPNDASASLLIEKVSAVDADQRMPPEGEGERLTPGQVAALTAWISEGAKSPADESVPVGPEEHWAYQLPKRATVPTSSGEVANSIDAFVFSKLEQTGLSHAPLADRRTLLRRLYLDLIGLPPTVQQQRAFLADRSQDAWQRVVDKLLDNPAYGERWGRHWMDVWRYSDWDGFQNELRGSQRHIWRWREWIIESLNGDKGYDRMVREMLAADELDPEDSDALRATGFLARNFHNSNRDIWLDAVVEHTAKAFLAMTVNCARCHDHKYDPIGQLEYYQMRAIFEPHRVRTDRVPGQADLMNDGLARVYDAKLDEPTYLYVAGNEKQPDKDHPLQAAVPSILQLPYAVEPIRLPILAAHPSLKDFIESEDLAAARAKVSSAKAALDNTSEADGTLPLLQHHLRKAEADLASLDARFDADKATLLQTTDAFTRKELIARAAQAERQAAETRAELVVLQRQRDLEQAQKSDQEDTKKKQAAIDKATAELEKARKALQESRQTPASDERSVYTSIGEAYPMTSTGRRFALAEWITDRRNPLTARVCVNHIWMRHFGAPLVPNVFDFGLRSPRPDHVDLLDWLAVELMENDWSMKHLHRLITNSRVYRLSSTMEPGAFQRNQAVDPDNRWLWRTNTRRLEAEVVRDSVLAVADELDRRQGGPDIDFLEGETVPRRSVYFRHAYEKQMLMLVTFDAAGTTECYRRSSSIIPQQALALSNSQLVISQARGLAARLTEYAPSRDEFIGLAFETILCRDCTNAEQVTCREFLDDQQVRLANAQELNLVGGSTKATRPASADPAQRARENLVHVLMNHNDFVTVR